MDGRTVDVWVNMNQQKLLHMNGRFGLYTSWCVNYLRDSRMLPDATLSFTEEMNSRWGVCYWRSKCLPKCQCDATDVCNDIFVVRNWNAFDLERFSSYQKNERRVFKGLERERARVYRKKVEPMEVFRTTFSSSFLAWSPHFGSGTSTKYICSCEKNCSALISADDWLYLTSLDREQLCAFMIN